MSAGHLRVERADEFAAPTTASPTRKRPSPGDVVRRRLAVGAADDQHEREADDIADVVLRSIQHLGQPTQQGRLPETTRIVRRATGSHAGAFTVPAETETRIKARTGRGGQPVPVDFAAGVQRVTGEDISGTRIHAGEDADQLARSIDARAFAAGGDVFFRRGELDTASWNGRRVLAHELAHVAQQGGTSGRAPRIRARTIQRLTDAERDRLFARASKLDYAMLTELAERTPLVAKLFQLSGTFGKGGGAELEGLRQMILVSTRKTADIASLVDDAVSAGDPSTLRTKLLKSKQRSSAEVYRMVDDCRGIVNEYFRAEQKDPGAVTRDLLNAAKTYDSTGDGSHDERLTHLDESGSRKARPVVHTLEDVMGKVRTVALIDLRNTHSPHVGPNAPLPPVPRDPETEELVSTPPRRAHVGVVGAGPVGLAAAIESRLQGAKVTMFEGRSDEYSRRQVLALDRSTIQRFARLGVNVELLDEVKGKGGGGNRVAVKYIEKALRERALELGIEIRTDMRLVSAKKKGSASRTTAVFQVGDDKKARRWKRLDLLVVAAGSGIARADKYTGTVLSDELGFQYSVQQAKDYAVVGLFEPSQQGNERSGGTTDPWTYRFNTRKVTYLLQQVPKSVYDEFRGPGGDKKLEAHMRRVAKDHYQMGDTKLGPDVNSKGQKSPNLGVFPIEIQQAKQFVNESLRALVIGDSAGTPHPHTGSGLNTGMREIDALGDVVASLQREAQMKQQVKDAKDDDPEAESPDVVNAALRAYNRELKTLTDFMINKAMKTLAEQHTKYMNEALAAVERDFGSRLKWDTVLHKRVAGIARSVAGLTGKDSDQRYDLQLSVLMARQEELAQIRAKLAS